MPALIDSVLAWEALDSRGHPTIGCVVRCRGGAEGEAFVPAGASAGSHEAHERRDGGVRYGGRGVSAAVAAINGEILDALRGSDVTDQTALDAVLRTLDGTGRLSRLGANAILAVSLACCRAAAAATAQPLWRHLAGDAEPLLPMPMINIVSGGAHAGGIVDVQDYLVIPVGARSFSEAMEWTARVRTAAAHLVASRGGNAALVADEGGLAHRFSDNTEPLELLCRAIEDAGLRPLEDVAIAVDVAATQLLDGHGYHLARERRSVSAAELAELIIGWTLHYPVISVEDPLAEDDWDGVAGLTARLDGVQVIGDDLFVTDAQRLQRGIDSGAANALLAKINQHGTISGTAAVVRQAQAAGYAVVVSARSGETEDSSIADLAVGWRAGQIKVGSLTRAERTAKWNRLLRIEAELGDNAVFAGRDVLAGARPEVVAEVI